MSMPPSTTAPGSLPSRNSLAISPNGIHSTSSCLFMCSMILLKKVKDPVNPSIHGVITSHASLSLVVSQKLEDECSLEI